MYKIVYWVLMVIGAVFLFHGLTGIVKYNISTKWVSTEGRITESKVSSLRSRDPLNSPIGGRSAQKEIDYLINYEYNVNGIKYVGNRVSFSEILTEIRVREVVNNYPIGKQVVVSYVQSEPTRSALERSRGDMWSFLLKIAVGLLFCGFALRRLR